MTPLSIKKQSRKELFQILDWDSNFFGYKVAKINTPHLGKSGLENLLEKLVDKGAELVYWFVDPEDQVSNRAAQETNGFLADEKVTYATALPTKKNYSFLSHKIKPYLLKPASKQLISLALHITSSN